MKKKTGKKGTTAALEVLRGTETRFGARRFMKHGMINTRIPPGARLEVEAYIRWLGTPSSHFIRLAIAEYMERHPRQGERSRLSIAALKRELAQP